MENVSAYPDLVPDKRGFSFTAKQSIEIKSQILTEEQLQSTSESTKIASKSEIDAESVLSGDSLLKTFTFIPNEDSPEMIKCMEFWKNILIRNLKPIKCILPQKSKTVVENTEEDKTPKNEDRIIWFKALDELRARNLIKPLTTIKKKPNYCKLRRDEATARFSGTRKSQISKDIVNLNDWESASKPSKSLRLRIASTYQMRKQSPVEHDQSECSETASFNVFDTTDLVPTEAKKSRVRLSVSAKKSDISVKSDTRSGQSSAASSVSNVSGRSSTALRRASVSALSRQSVGALRRRSMSVIALSRRSTSSANRRFLAGQIPEFVARDRMDDPHTSTKQCGCGCQLFNCICESLHFRADECDCRCRYECRCCEPECCKCGCSLAYCTCQDFEVCPCSCNQVGCQCQYNETLPALQPEMPPPPPPELCKCGCEFEACCCEDCDDVVSCGLHICPDCSCSWPQCQCTKHVEDAPEDEDSTDSLPPYNMQSWSKPNVVQGAAGNLWNLIAQEKTGAIYCTICGHYDCYCMRKVPVKDSESDTE